MTGSESDGRAGEGVHRLLRLAVHGEGDEVEERQPVSVDSWSAPQAGEGFGRSHRTTALP